MIGDHAPHAIKEQSIENYFGRKVAIDASMSIYQFLIAVRSEGNVLMNEAGETTRSVCLLSRWLAGWLLIPPLLLLLLLFLLLVFLVLPLVLHDHHPVHDHRPHLKSSHGNLLPHAPNGRQRDQAAVRLRWKATHHEVGRGVRSSVLLFPCSSRMLASFPFPPILPYSMIALPYSMIHPSIRCVMIDDPSPT